MPLKLVIPQSETADKALRIVDLDGEFPDVLYRL